MTALNQLHGQQINTLQEQVKELEDEVQFLRQRLSEVQRISTALHKAIGKSYEGHN